MNDWKPKLVDALKLETVDAGLINNIDDILSWITVKDKDLSYQVLEQEYGQQILSERFEEFFDRLIVGDSSTGEMFSVELARDDAKRRYRKLIRIFHPDRGAKSSVWLNYRAEKINKAYQDYLDNIESAELVTIVEPVVSSKEKTNTSSNSKLKYRPNVWRKRLGSPKEFQSKVIAVLVIFPLLLVTIVFFGNQQSFILGSKFIAPKKINNVDQGAASERFGQPALDVYTLSPQVQGILKEADRLIAEDNIVIDSGLSFSQLNEDVDPISIMPGDSEGRVQEASEEISSICNGSNSHTKVTDIDGKRLLVNAIELRIGPSKGCELIKSLSPGISVQLQIETETGEWTRVIVEDESMKGWVESEVVMSSSEEKDIVSLSRESSIVKKKSTKQIASIKPKSIAVQLKKNEVEPDRKINNKPQIAPVFFKSIERFKFFYESGDSKSVAELFMSSGRENEIKGADNIRKYYRKAFRRTVDRKFKYTIDEYELDSDSVAVIKGILNLSYRAKKSKKPTDIDASYKIVLVKFSDNYKIAAFDWSN